MSIEAGTRVGRYEIEAPLGRGGMGEVYRAFDSKMGRRVALKFLPQDLAADPRRVQRLLHEARTASSLNHPNILTVYDTGQAEDGARFFATELVEGVTLREHIRSRRLRPAEAVELCAQIASALAAAHAAGVVHRDVKPENVMLRPDGFVKVLDFGLAKLAGPLPASVDAEAATLAMQVHTDAGSVMGTVFYMSPEQARGEAVDARTDVWSLGVVLYEMLTGRVPFSGQSVAHTLVSIQEDEPPPLASVAGQGASPLQRVVSGALAKSRDARPTASQTLDSLRQLRRRLEEGAAESPAAEPSTTAPPPAREREGERVPVGGSALARGSAALARGSRRGKLTGAALAIGALGAGLYGLGVYRREPATRPVAPLEKMKFAKLAVDGRAGRTVGAVISPDGRFIARVADDGGRRSLRLRQSATPAERELAALSPSDGADLSFAPDGDSLYYVGDDDGAGHGTLYRVSLLGDARKLISDVGGAVAPSPDGSKIAFRRAATKGSKSRPALPEEEGEQLLVADADGGGEQLVLTRRLAGGIGSIAWSPDGRVIAYVSKGRDDEDDGGKGVGDAGRGDGRDYENVEAVRVEWGARLKFSPGSTVSSARWRAISALAWLRDGGGLVLSGKGPDAAAGEPSQLWHIPYPEGAPLKITNGPGNYVSVCLTSDSGTALVFEDRHSSDISVMPDGDGERAQQLTAGGGYIVHIAWTPDGRILYDSNAGGGYDIWVMNADGSGGRALTGGPDHDLAGVASPDGRYIVYRSDKTDGSPASLRRMDSDGRDPLDLVSGLASASALQVSPDSRWVFYTSPDESGASSLWKVSIDGGEPSKLRAGGGEYRLSPDGRRFAAFDPAPNTPAQSSPRRVVVFPAEGAGPVRSFALPPGAGNVLDWSRDGRQIDYIAPWGGTANVLRQSLDGGKPKPLTRWTGDARVSWFAWSNDGRTLGVVRDTSAADLVLIKDFR